MVARNGRSNPLVAPAVFGLIDPSEACLVLKHEPNLSRPVENFRQLADSGVNFFEESISSGDALFGCLLRGMTFLHP